MVKLIKNRTKKVDTIYLQASNNAVFLRTRINKQQPAALPLIAIARCTLGSAPAVAPQGGGTVNTRLCRSKTFYDRFMALCNFENITVS